MSTRKVSTVGSQNKPLIVLTVDAEEEWDWSAGLPSPPYSTENIKCIPAFQRRCSAIGLVPTYFVDSAVLKVESNRRILNKYFERNECDIGAQLHPWCTLPVEEPLSEFHSHSINLHRSLVARKLKTLTVEITEIFGVHPFSFRCGRWGLNGTILELLANSGYQVDSSVRPYYSTEYFSYNTAPNDPYWPSFEDVCVQSAQRQVLEVPVADGFSNANFERASYWHAALGRSYLKHFRVLGILSHLNLLRRIIMTPEVTSSRDICRCIDMQVKRGNPVITLFMHSSDLLPGATAYAPDEASVERFITVLEKCAQHAISRHDAKFVGLREAHRILMSRGFY